MIIYLKSKTKEQFQRRFSEVIQESKKHDMTFLGFSTTGSLEGSINGDAFTLVRTAGFISTLPQRHFWGTLSYDDGRLTAKGNFRFSKVFYIILAIIGICAFLFLLLSHEGILTIQGIIKALLISASIPIAILGFCLLASLPFEKEAIRVLESV